MNVLMLSGDAHALDSSSDVFARLQYYAKGLMRLRVIVPAPARHTPVVAGALVVEPVALGVRGRLRLCQYVPPDRPDMVTAQDPFEFGFAAWRIARRLGVPFELQVHTDIFSPAFARHSWKNFVRVYIARMVLPRAPCVRVVSERIRASLIHEIPILHDRITVIPVSVSKRGQPPFSDKKCGVISPPPVSSPATTLHHTFGQKMVAVPFSVLAVSRLTKEKDLPTLLRAFARVRDVLPDARLTIVGDGPERGRLERLADTLGIAQEVRFEGWHADPAAFYARANVFVQTSLFEGYGRSIIEAAHAGVPIVSTDVGVVGYELSRQSIEVVLAGDAAAFARAIIAQLTDPKAPVAPRVLDLPASAARIREAWASCRKWGQTPHKHR